MLPPDSITAPACLERLLQPLAERGIERVPVVEAFDLHWLRRPFDDLACAPFGGRPSRSTFTEIVVSGRCAATRANASRALCTGVPSISSSMSPGRSPAFSAGLSTIQVGEQHTVLRKAELRRLLLGDVLRHDADPAAHHATARDDVVQHAAHHVHRDGEADAFHAQALGDDGRVDADERAGACRPARRPNCRR